MSSPARKMSRNVKLAEHKERQRRERRQRKQQDRVSKAENAGLILPDRNATRRYGRTG